MCLINYSCSCILKKKNRCPPGGRVAAVRRVNWFGESDLDLKSIIKENLL